MPKAVEFNIDSIALAVAKSRADYMKHCALSDVRIVGYPSDSDHARRLEYTKKHYNPRQ